MPNQSPPKHKDPIRETPLRDPGQSSRERMVDQFTDATIPWLVVAFLLFSIAIVEWIRWHFDAPYYPVSITGLAVVVSGIAVWKFWRASSTLHQQKLGIKGERAVGQYLQGQLIPHNYVVMHDISFDNFNIDHVAIGPGGVFAIEVKTRSKPRRQDARVVYDGQRVLINGHTPDRDPVQQARAAARDLGELLEKYSGEKVQVRPVVLFPGWYVDRQPKGVETWVLNPKSFVQFALNETTKLTPARTRVLAESLARYVREGLE